MYASKRRFARLSLVALGFLLACGEPTAPVTPVAKPTAPAVMPNANLVDVFNGLLNVTNGVTTLIGDLLPCAVTTDQWNTANIGPNGGRLNVGPHSLVIPRRSTHPPNADFGARRPRQPRPRRVLAERSAVLDACDVDAQLRRLRSQEQAGAGSLPEGRPARQRDRAVEGSTASPSPSTRRSSTSRPTRWRTRRSRLSPQSSKGETAAANIASGRFSISVSC